MAGEREQVADGSVVSADGTRIGYRRFGEGPAVVVLHGGVNASQHMVRLGRALADAFTVVLPDRRGRGSSGPFGPDYAIEREDEDLAAVVEHTGAELVFGTANGALFALHGSVGLSRVRKVAAYEPLLLWGGPDDDAVRRIFGVMRGLIRTGRLGEGVRYSAVANLDRAVAHGQAPKWVGGAVRAVPAALGAGVLDLVLRTQRSREGNVAWRDLVVALPDELEPVLGTERTLQQYRGLDADVLLMVGGATDPMFLRSAEALHGVLPSSTVLRLPGLNHDAAQTYGKPEAIAAAVRLFFQR